METHDASGESRLQATLAETNRRLNARLQELNTIYTVGKSVTATLDAGEVLERITVAAVNLTRADEGFLLLKEGDRLFVRAVKAWASELPERLHQKTNDTVAWQVIRSGRPVLLNRETRIATGSLAQTLLYVPLQVPEVGTMGVLAVVNRQNETPFTENQLFTLSSLADFAAIALENARLFAQREAERSRLSAILENVAEAIVVIDEAHRLWLWSATAAQAFGLTEEARGRPAADYLTNAEIQDLFSQADQDGSVLHAEITLDDRRVYNAQLSTINGVGRVVIMQEITHLKKMDRLKTEFVSTVSHDLRSPLTTVQGYIALLDRAGSLNQMQADFVDKALTSLHHITALISDLLDVGRIEAGYDLEMQPVCMDEIVLEVIEAAKVSAAEADIDLSVCLSQPPLQVWGNMRRLRQVLENLVGNAIKYNSAPGKVEVRAWRNEAHIMITVRDTGIGIPAEEQARIFERFYRVNTVDTEGIQGTGLGLAIVKSVIEKHNGRVWVESTLGIGSTFAFLLPLYQPPT